MNVFVIEQGCYYEGTAIESIHETAAGALKAALEIIDSDRYHNYNKIDPGTYRYGITRAIHQWADGSDILYIKKHEVKP